MPSEISEVRPVAAKGYLEGSGRSKFTRVHQADATQYVLENLLSIASAI